ncbi:MAG: glycosyl hydrolase 115 family protein [Bacteroidales bacterium]|nr:glycosyl hydrolase 115 family protein [Bacteroidales bacterium]
MLSRIQRIFATTIVLAMTALTIQASAFVLSAHHQVKVNMDDGEDDVVATALSLMEKDLMRVLNAPVTRTGHHANIIIGTAQGAGEKILQHTGVDLTWLNNKTQGFIITTTDNGQLVIAGRDALGTAYGIIEFTRLLGVSPWEWWADAEPEVRTELRLPDGYLNRQAPDVLYRGIQLSDLQWGLEIWAHHTYEPNSTFSMGSKTATRIFELMLRLRANLFWPAKESTANSYFATPECHATARNYGILMGHGPAQPLPAPLRQPLICQDDGFGYISHFPTGQEIQHPGGNGVLYHASFSGAPHDYLWLGTASPFLLYQQLTEAYYHGAYRLWVLDVGDIKPSEYQLALFMDLAWNVTAVEELSVARHIEEFIAQNVGRDIARLSSIYLKEHYHLSFQRKPEHLAGTRLHEPADGVHNWSAIRDLPWSEKRIRHRLGRYDQLERNVKWIADSVRRAHPARYNAFFQLVEYPILAAAAQNDKYLIAQLARHGLSYLQRDNVNSTWRRSDEAHNLVQSLTLKYNSLCGGKWNGIISSNPRSLTVFQPIPHIQGITPLVTDARTIAVFYGASYNASSFSGSSILDPVLGLGASIRAMPVPKGCNITYKFAYQFVKEKTLDVEIHMLPTHPIDAQQRFSLSLDGGAPQTFTYDAPVGSETWKQNVTQNYASVIAHLPLTKLNGNHELKFEALDEGVVIDEVFVYKEPQTVRER